MSEICGIYCLDGSRADAAWLHSMLDAMTGMRGTRGVWCEGPAGLGKRIQRTTPGSLTENLLLTDGNDDLVVTADVRIDNRKELIAQLKPGRNPGMHITDNELLLLAYGKWEERCVEKLLGDFSFAIWDSRKQKLFCARDHIGVKPFYYYSTDRIFVFASEIMSILSLPGIDPSLNEIAVAEFLIAGLLEKEITFYQDIYRLSSAHTKVVGEDGMFKRQYWHPRDIRKIHLSSDREYEEAFREKIFEATDCRLRSSGEVGVQLSGGLDSSSVACAAACQLRNRNKQLVAVSSVLPESYDGPGEDEREFIKAVCEQESNIDVDYVTAEGATPFANIREKLDIAGEPFRDGFHYMTDALHSAAAKKGTRVLLSGFGGDMFASYKGDGALAHLVRTGELSKAANILKKMIETGDSSSREIIYREVIVPLVPLFVKRLYYLIRGRNPEDLTGQSAISPGFLRKIGGEGFIRERFPKAFFQKIYDPGSDLLQTLTPGYLEQLLSGQSLTAGRYGMDIRFPLLDKRVVEFVLSVPVEQHVKNGWKRSLIRRSMEGVLPPEVQWRRTKGAFSPDFESRFAADIPRIRSFISGTDKSTDIWEYVDRYKIKDKVTTIDRSEKGSSSDYSMLSVVWFGLVTAYFLSEIKR